MTACDPLIDESVPLRESYNMKNEGQVEESPGVIKDPDSCNDTMSSDELSSNECHDSITSLPSPEIKKRNPPGYDGDECMSSFRKMCSTGHIEESQSKCSNEIIPPFRKISCNNHILKTDLESGPDKEADSKIQDSHTSYRRALEADITELKLLLVEAQSRADTLQNDFNKAKSERDVYKDELQELRVKYNESKNQSEELSTVVSHLQRNAKETAEERASLSFRVAKSESECQRLQSRYRLIRFESRQTKKDLAQTKLDLEGKAMESQGLRSENEWLKRQIHQYDKNSGVISDHDDAALESTDDDEKLTNIHEMTQYLSNRGGLNKSTSKRFRTRRSPRSSLSTAADENTSSSPRGSAIIEGMDPLSSYTSFAESGTIINQSTSNLESYSDQAASLLKQPATNPNQFFSNLAKRHGMETGDDSFDDNKGPEYRTDKKSWHQSLPTIPFGRKEKTKNSSNVEEIEPEENFGERENFGEENRLNGSEQEPLFDPNTDVLTESKNEPETSTKSSWWSFGFSSTPSKRELETDDDQDAGDIGESAQYEANDSASDSYKYSSDEFLQSSSNMNAPNPQFLADDGAISVGNGTLVPKRFT